MDYIVDASSMSATAIQDIVVTAVQSEGEEGLAIPKVALYPAIFTFAIQAPQAGHGCVSRRCELWSKTVPSKRVQEF